MEAGAAGLDGARMSAPAGWYANPEGPGERYWSGEEWGQMRPEAVAVTDTASASRPDVAAGQPGAWWAAMLAGAAMIVGGFGPWATALGIVSINGTHGDGWLVIAAGALGLVALWSEGRTRRGGGALVFAGIAGAAGAAVAISDFVQLESAQGTLFGENVDLVDPAWGIYMAMLAGVVLTGAAIALHRSRRTPGAS